MKSPVLAWLALACAPAAFPAPAAPLNDLNPQLTEIRKIAQGLNYRQGETVLGHGLAKVAVPAQFRYLDAADTNAVLSRIWNNPKQDGILGSIVPVGFDPFDGDSWIVIISYAADGHVRDDDAATIDYPDLLQKMKSAVLAANPEREKQGYKRLELVGWATPPHYDASAHKFYWAKEFKFGGDAEHTLNYNIRILGRQGVLVLNAVAPMSMLPRVEAATPAILSMVDYQPGNRYADFRADTDKTATYGLAALVAGGVAAKAGFFKLLWVGILAFKKLIIVALIAAAASIRKLIAWIKGNRAGASAIPPPPAAS